MALKQIQYGKQSIDDDDIRAVEDVLNSERITQGNAVSRFENELNLAFSSTHTICCNSGTAALFVAYKAMGLGPGDSVIVPAITFAATANAVLMTGADVVFCDCNAETGTLDINHLKLLLTNEKETKNIKAVTVVHLAGQSCDIRAFHKLTCDFGIELVEDACHAIGSHYQHETNKKIPVGSCQFSSVATFSFHPVKTITTGEGGALSTNSEAIAIRARRLVSHGIERNTQNFVGESLTRQKLHNEQWYYEVQELSGNYRLSDINAALGLSQLKKLDNFVNKRRELWSRYAKLLHSTSPFITHIKPYRQDLTCWHLFVALIDFEALNIERPKLIDSLKGLGIGTQVHYIPVYRHPIYTKKYGQIRLRGAEKYYQRCLTLPLHTEMALEDVDRVVDALTGLVHV